MWIYELSTSSSIFKLYSRGGRKKEFGEKRNIGEKTNLQKKSIPPGPMVAISNRTHTMQRIR